MENEFDNEEYLNSLPPSVREDMESGNKGAWTIGPAEVAAGAVIAPQAVKAWGLGKVLDVGMQAAFPDAEDTLFEQALSSRPKVKAGAKATRLLYEKIAGSIFDERLPNTQEATSGLLQSLHQHPQIGKLSKLQKQTDNRNILDQYLHKKAVEGPHKSWQDQGIPQTELSKDISDLSKKHDMQYSDLDPSQSRDWSKYERDEAAYFQNPRWPRDKEFNEIGNIIKSELKELYPDIPISHWRNHHTNPIKQGAWLVDGLKPEFREEVYKVLIKEGISAGHDPKQLNVIPKNIHTKIHRFVNNYLGKKYSVQKLEKTYFNGAKLSTIPFEERMPAIKQYANVIRESNEKIYDLMTALAVNKKHGPNVLPEVLAELNSKVDDVSDIGLDGIIKQIESEYGLQKIQGTVPKINVQQLAEQYSPNTSIQERLIRDLTSGKYTRKQLKRKYPGFKAEQKDLFE